MVNDEANELTYGTGAEGSARLAQARELLKALPQHKQNSSLNKNSIRSGLKLHGEMESGDQFTTMDPEKVALALKKQEMQQEEFSSGDQKRRYNSMSADVDVTQEGMEAFRLKRDWADDPMAKVIDQGDSNEEVLLEYKK